MSFSFTVGSGSSQSAKLTDGTYYMLCERAEIKSTKAGTGRYLECTFEIVDGPMKGRRVWMRYNFDNPSEKAVEIALGQLSELALAVGFAKDDKLSDPSQLLELPFVGTIEGKTNDRGNLEFSIVKYQKSENVELKKKIIAKRIESAVQSHTVSDSEVPF